MNKNNKQGEKAWWQEGMVVFAQVSGWIAGPIIAALFIGAWLDNKFQTGTFYFYVCIAVAFVVSNVGLVLGVIKYNKKIGKKR